MFIAKMETENYSFTSLGTNEQQAKQALLDAWNKHAGNMARYGRPVPLCKTFTKLNDLYDVEFVKLNPGECEQK